MTIQTALDTTTAEGSQPLTAGLAELRDALRPLEQHVVDLDLLGYTVIPGVLSPERAAAIGQRLEELAAEEGEAPVDATSHTARTQEVTRLLERGGTLFEELVLEPAPFALVTYLLGRSRVLSSFTGYVKGPGGPGLTVHSDTAFMPDPVPLYASLANVNYCLTNYTAADGCLTIVPGSHRYGHRPRAHDDVSNAVSVEAPPGSAIVFHGNTWHGANPRVNPGNRLMVSVLYARMFMRPQEDYRDISDAVLDANPPILRSLVGRDVPTGWRSTEEAAQIMRRRKEFAPAYYRTRVQHT